MANDTSQLFGDYAPNPPADDVATPLQGLASFADSVNFATGCGDTNCGIYISADVIKALSSNNDVIFVVLGTGESSGVNFGFLRLFIISLLFFVSVPSTFHDDDMLVNASLCG